METMEEEDEQKYQNHFKKFIENDIGHDDLEDMYQNAHKKIRESPEHKPTDKKNTKHTVVGKKTSDGKKTWIRPRKCSKKDRMNKVQQKIRGAQRRMLNAAD